MCDLFTDQRLQQGHLVHARAQRGAQGLCRVAFGAGHHVELVVALADDVPDAVVALVVLLRALGLALVIGQGGELADGEGRGAVRVALGIGHRRVGLCLESRDKVLLVRSRARGRACSCNSSSLPLNSGGSPSSTLLVYGSNATTLIQDL